MENILQKALEVVDKSVIAYSKFITANDTGATGGHQAGFHLHKGSWPIFFETQGIKGENKEKFISINWQGDLTTDSRAIYYGKGTRNEYRLTRFGRGFPFLTSDNVGDLLILGKIQDREYEAWVLSRDEDIEGFLDAVNISPDQTNGIIPRQNQIYPQEVLNKCFEGYINSVQSQFPSTYDMATNARICFINSLGITDQQILANPDEQLLEWINAEYDLFKMFENDRYAEFVEKPFPSIEELIKTANSILNRRKSRAGKSLEIHLENIFSRFNLLFDTQA